MLELPLNYKGPAVEGERFCLLNDLSRLGFTISTPESKSAKETSTLGVFFNNERVAYLNSHMRSAGILGCEFVKDGERTGTLNSIEVHRYVRQYLEKNLGHSFDLKIVNGTGSNKANRYVVFGSRAAALKLLTSEVGVKVEPKDKLRLSDQVQRSVQGESKSTRVP